MPSQAMKEFPLVSIITPIYNSEKYLETCIASVRAQSYPHWELLLVDDCSSDASRQLVEKYAAEDERIRVLTLPQWSGPAPARNLAIKEAKGRFIAFLDSDDSWHAEKLSTQIGIMLQEGCSMSCTAYEAQKEGNKHIAYIHEVKEQINYTNLLLNNQIGCLTFVYDTDKIGKQYMPILLKRQDYGLWLRLAREFGPVRGIPKVLATYLIRKNSISHNKWSLIRYQWAVYYSLEKKGWLKSLFYTINWAIKGILKSISSKR